MRSKWLRCEGTPQSPRSYAQQQQQQQQQQQREGGREGGRKGGGEGGRGGGGVDVLQKKATELLLMHSIKKMYSRKKQKTKNSIKKMYSRMF
jgi:hypothetical protein